MALGFLSDIGNFAQGAQPIVSSIGGLLNAIRGNKGIDQIVDQSQQPTDAESWYSSLMDDLLNPNSQHVNDLAQSDYKANTEAFLTQLKEMGLQSQRMAARGQRPTMFNPERRDETLDYLVSRGLPQMQQAARDNARKTISDAASGIKGMIPVQYLRQQGATKAMQTQEASRQIAPMSRTMDVLGGIQGLIKAISPQQQPAPSSKFIEPMPTKPSFFSMFG